MSDLSKRPPEWFREDIGKLARDPFPVRFNEDAEDAIDQITERYGVSRARAIRILVNRSLRELGAL